MLLGNEFGFSRPDTAAFIDLSGPKEEMAEAINRVMSDEIIIPDGEAFTSHPGELAFAASLESVTLPANTVGWLDGRSSLARLGLMVHVTAHRRSGLALAGLCSNFTTGRLLLALRPKMVTAPELRGAFGPAACPYNNANAKYKSQQVVL